MVIINVIGGLGNQMFQYSFYQSLLNKGVDAYLDLSEFKTYKLHNGFELERIFDLSSVRIASATEVEKYTDRKKDFLSRKRRKLFGSKRSHIREHRFMPAMLHKHNNLYLDGYWQSAEYFSHIEFLIRDEFRFDDDYCEENTKLIEKARQTESVSIHIRRGDYISNPKVYESYGHLCDLDYYNKAIAIIKSKIENPTFFVFSNDMNWVKDNIELPRTTEFVNLNQGVDSFRDMQIMSECRHNIIANSSFSWWGAWLNNNPTKTVIAPTPWMLKDTMTYQRTPANWQEINVAKEK
jgi:hypothetical protein